MSRLFLIAMVLLWAHGARAQRCPQQAEIAGHRLAPLAAAVDIGHGRRLFLHSDGVGGPTVVLLSGKGTDADDWSHILDPADPAHNTPGDDVGAGMGNLHPSDDAVFPSVARFTRVCAYDRPDTRFDGADLSTPGPQPHTLDLDVADLHALLAAAHLPGPYIFVAHSYAGLIATLYARTYPDSVVGLVMVDAATELSADVISPLRLANWDQTNRITSAQVREGVEVVDAFRQINAAPPLPSLPTIVLTADKPYRIDLLPPDDRRVTFADWLAAQDRLACSRGAEHIRQTHSGHHIYLYSPALVIEAIRQLVGQLRTP